MAPAATCLNIAIDHRTRKLLRPVRPNRSGTEKGNHISTLEDVGQWLSASEEEIRVTARLAGPPTRGGIAIVLQQPRDNHPFEEGTEAVINDCASLKALREIFSVVSCGTLDLERDVSVIDLLPFVSEQLMEQMTGRQIAAVFQTCVDSFCEKEPDVVLCAGKIWLPRQETAESRSMMDNRKIKGEAWKLESLKIGDTFDKYPVVTLRGDYDTKIRRVNGFHPSYAVNRFPEYQELRQLQILVAAEACGVYGHTWVEDGWMKRLRESCSQISRNGERRKYVDDYNALYFEATYALFASLEKITRSGKPADLYASILKGRLGPRCNDLSLCLRELSRLKRRGWPERYDKKNKANIDEIAAITRYLAEKKWWNRSCLESHHLKNILEKGMQDLHSCTSKLGRDTIDINLDRACIAFLQIAINVEDLLGKLLEKREEDDKLNDMMSSLAL